MAKHVFQKGNNANPLGAGAHNPITKRVKKMTQDEVAEVGALLLQGNVEEIQRVAKDPESSVIKVWICSVAINAIKKGDATALNTLLDRLVGKVKESIDVNMSARLTDEELIERAKQLSKQIEDKSE